MDCEKNPFLQMSQDQIQKIEAVLSSEQARALLMETSNQNVFCDSKIEDMLSHETHLDLHKFSGSLDVTLEDSLQDLEHLVLGHHDNPELFSETADVGTVAADILHSTTRITSGADVVKLDHSYSLSCLSDQEDATAEMAEDDEPSEEACETEELSLESKVRSPPVRRSQRQLDKIEREKVEKIRAENAALQQRELEEMLKFKEESNDDDDDEDIKQSVSDSGSLSKVITDTKSQNVNNLKDACDASFESNADPETVSESEKSEALEGNQKKSKKSVVKVKSEATETDTLSKGKSVIKSLKETEKGTKVITAEIRKKIYRKEKSVDILGPSEPELFSAPDKIVKQRNDSFSDSSDKTLEKKHPSDVLHAECEAVGFDSASDHVAEVKATKEGNVLAVAVLNVLCNSDSKKELNHLVPQKQQLTVKKEAVDQRSLKSSEKVSEVLSSHEDIVVKGIDKVKSISDKKKVSSRNASKMSRCHVRKADSSSDNKKEISEDNEEEFVDDPNDSDWASDDDPEKLWCICRKPSNNRFMIQCDSCKDWFHGTCVGVTKQQGRQMEKSKKEWKCPPCIQNFKEEILKASKQDVVKPHVVKAERVAVQQNCIICKSLAPKDSVYCTPNCIEKHAKRILHLTNQRKTKKELKEKVQQRIVVLDSRTGKLLTGPNAPTEDNLITWLKDNPTFQALKPGPSIVKESKALPPALVEKKQKQAMKEKPNTQTEIDLVRKNVIKTLTDILLTRCKSDSLPVASELVKNIATEIEDELFKYFKDTGAKYKSKYRSLMFNVKDPRNQGLFRKIVKGKIPPDTLVRMSPEELASKELAKWRERETQHTLDMIKKEQLEKQNAPATYVKKTHKGEIEIEDGSVLVIEKEDEKSLKEPTADLKERDLKEMLTDTTVEHRAHLFDLNCKICTGRMAPPEDEDLAAKKAKISHTINIQKEMSQSAGLEKEVSVHKKSSKSVKIFEKTVKKKKKREEVSDSEPTSTVCFGSPEQVKKLKKSDKSQSSVWKGFIFMVDVAKFITNAYKVSGSTVSVSVDIPDTVQVCGRIAPEEVWSYLSKIKQSGNKEIIILRFQPSSEEEKIAYENFYNYLNSRKRYGVVRNSSKMIKDFYIIPLPSRSPVPTVLMPFHGPGLDAVRANLLLGVIVRHKGKSRSSGTSQVQSVRTKVEKIEVQERSYTPPLDSLPCQSTAIDSSNSPAYIPSSEKILGRSSPQKRSLIDDEPYEPSYTPPLEKFPRTEIDDDKPYDPEDVDNTTIIVTKMTPPPNSSNKSPEDGHFMSASSDLAAQKKLLAELTRQVEVQKEQIELQKSLSSTKILPHGVVSDVASRSDTSNLPHTLQNILDNIKKKAQDLKESGKVASTTSDHLNREISPRKTSTSLSALSAKELLEKAERELAEMESTKNNPPPKPSVSWHVSSYREPPPPGDESPVRKEANPTYMSYTNPLPSVYVQPAVRYPQSSGMTPNQEISQQRYHHQTSSFAYRQEAAGSRTVVKNTEKSDVRGPPTTWEKRDKSGSWQRWSNY